MPNPRFDPGRALAATLAGALLAATLGGCSQIPAYQRPSAPVPDQWPWQSGARTAAPLAGWQDYFADDDLKQLIHAALSNNRDLRIAALATEQARAQLGLRQADQLPTLNATLTGSRAPSSSGGITSSYTGGLLVSAYELDFFGRVASLKEQALAQYLATTEARTTAQIGLVATVAQAWFSLLADEELLAVSNQTVATREESLRLISLKEQVGAASALDVSLARTLLESARATQAQQQRQRALDENALQLVLGQALPTAVRARIASARLAQVHLAELPPGLPSDLLTRRPDIRQAEQQLLASNASIGAARAAFFPRISLTVGAGSASSALSGLFKDGSWGWTMAPQLLLPIFDAGRNQANLDAATAGRDIAVAQYEKTIQSAFREVADALAGRETLVRQLAASQALLDAESQRTELTRMRLDQGAASQLDWLDAQRSLFTARQQLVQTRLAVLQNQVSLYKALGGGVQATASPS